MKKSRALILVFVGYALVLCLDLLGYTYGEYFAVLIPLSFVGVAMMLLGCLDLSFFKDRILNFVSSCLIVASATLLTYVILAPRILMTYARVFLGISYQ